MQPKLSVITATFNAATVLPGLIASLKAQTDSDFEWVVADGGSTDETLHMLAKVSGELNIRLDSRQDFGIYDALNRAIRLSTGDYYLVMGADDTLFPDAIEKYRSYAMASDADIVTAKIVCDGKVVGVRRHWPWLYGPFAYVSGHSVGTLIRRNLHDEVGFYSRNYPIAADQLFLKQVMKSGGQVVEADFIAGEFLQEGLSGSDIIGTLSEGLRVQIKTGEYPISQFAIFVIRVIKNWHRISRGG